jgi:hypothetical protein
MDLIVGYLSADPSIKGICLQDYQNKEEYVFTAFIKLACSAFNGKTIFTIYLCLVIYLLIYSRSSETKQ